MALATWLTSDYAGAGDADFRVPPECASKEEFLSLVHARLPPNVQRVPTFRARIMASSPTVVGELEFNAGPPRRLAGSSCVEVLDAMAVVLALRAEQARDDELQMAKPTEEPEPAGWLATTVNETNVSRPAVGSPAPVNVSVPSPGGDSPVRYRLGSGVAVLRDAAPGVAVGIQVVATLEGEQRLLWMLRLSVEHAATGQVDAPPAAVLASLSLARLSGCVLDVRLGSLRVWPCLQLAGGIFHAQGVRSAQIPRVRSVDRPWVSIGPALRAEFEVAGRLVIAGEAAFPLKVARHELRFQLPDATLYRSRVVSSYFGLTAEFAFGRSNRSRQGIAD